MPLSVGTKLGPYEILAPIGKGGMGEVYRARDTRLKRDVALKVLPETFARDPDRMGRFQREAEVLASLNHPNIAHIYGLESNALVMELVEGESPKGPMPFDETWKIAAQIAAALEYAHDKHIIHRDLKPANVKVTPDGVVKLLDFGLAKAFTASPPTGDAENAPTVTMGETQPGTILGTPEYMSPEQARGAAVDKRTDIWAFGVVVYELLSGKRLFQGGSFADTFSRILTADPDWTRIPPHMQPLLKSCLEKEARRRLRDIGDAWRLLEVAPAEAQLPRLRRIGVMVLSGIVVGALLVAIWRPRQAGSPPPPVVRVDMDLGPSDPRGPANAAGASVVLSPDGSRLAIATRGSDGKTHLYTRRLDQGAASEIADTEGAAAPFFSPDGKWIGFFGPGKLRKVPVDGGPVVTLCDAPSGRGASWGEDGNIIFAADVQTRLYRVPALGGGAPVPLTEFHRGEISHRWPQVLPGGKAVLFTALNAANFAAFDEAEIQILSLPGGQVKTLWRGGSYGRVLATGHLLFVRHGTAFALPFDAERLEVRGKPVPVLEQVRYGSAAGVAQFEVARSGTLVYEKGPADEELVVQWMDSTGGTQPLLNTPGAYLWLRFSPDGTRLVYRKAEGSGTDLWMYDWQRGIETRLTRDAAVHSSPVWSADGRYVVYQAEGGMFRVDTDGASKPQLFLAAQNTPYPESFTPDGKRLAYSVANPVSGDLDIWIVPVDATSGEIRVGKPEPLVRTPAHERDASFSADGRWLAYMSTESGSYEVYVRAFPESASGGGAKWQISNGGGFAPVWSRNAHELYYRSADGRILAVPYAVKDGAFVAEKPRVWSPTRVYALGMMPGFDVSPDGKRLAVLEPAASVDSGSGRHHVTLVLNFFEELRQRLAEGGK